MSTTEAPSIIEADGAINGYDPDLSDAELLHMYRSMVLTRAFDDTCMKLQRSGRVDFSVPNRGIEATQIGTAAAFEKDDWFFPSYRDFGVPIYHGVKIVDMMHNMFGNSLDNGRGRQMPVHFSFVEPIRLVSISSPLGTHIPQAVGAARAFQARGEDRVCLSCFGDGGTSTLGFHSALNFAGVWKSPVVFLCQNNGYAISCPSEDQTASDGYAVKAQAYGIPGIKVDGNDVLAVYKTVSEAVKRARAGEGPTMIECVTFRMGGHSTSDDPSRYVPKELFEKWAKRDPIEIFERVLVKRKLLDDKRKEEIAKDVNKEVQDAVKIASETATTPLETLFTEVYADIPAHLRRQGEASFDLARRKGDASAGDGSFPL